MGGGNSVNQAFGEGLLQERQFSEEVRPIHWTAGLWKLKSCCPHPLPENPPLCKTQENCVSRGGVAIANHCATVSLLRIENLLRRGICSTAGSFKCCDPAGAGTEPKNPRIPEIRKKYEIPHPGVAPENTKKKTEKSMKMVIFGPFSYFFGTFFVFLGGQAGVGDLVSIFFSIFFVFPGFRGFWLCASPGRIAILKTKANALLPNRIVLAPLTTGRKSLNSLGRKFCNIRNSTKMEIHRGPEKWARLFIRSDFAL